CREEVRRKEKRPAGGGAGLFPYAWPMGGVSAAAPEVGREEMPSFGYSRSRPWPPRWRCRPKKDQATLSSFRVFSKTPLIGLATSSAALLEADWRSLACST